MGIFWKMTIKDLIQICILVAIAYSAFNIKKQSELTCLSVEQQLEFNRNMLRPWVYIDPTKEMRINGTIFSLTYSTINIGYSPAFDIHCLAAISNSDKYPEDNFREKYIEKVPFFLFPSQRSTESSIEFDMKTFSKILSSKDAIAKYLKKNNLYLHTYLEYIDTDNNKYFLRSSWAFRLSKTTDKDIFPEFRFIFHSLDQIERVNSEKE